MQIGSVVVYGDAAIGLPSTKATKQEAQPMTTLTTRSELIDMVLAIEMAEEDLVDADTVWKAMTRHLQSRGLAEVGREEDLNSAQYWRARSYLEGWLACRRGEALTRVGCVRQIQRMWEVCPSLKAVTKAFHERQYRSRALDDLNDLQLRAVLGVTLAAWREWWVSQPSGGGPP